MKELAERIEFALSWSRVGYLPQGEITDQQKADIQWIKTRYSEVYAEGKDYWEATRIARIEFLETLFQEQELLNLCKKFIEDNEISCGETVYQCDHVAENSPEFIEKVVELVGFHKHEEEDKEAEK